MREIVIGLITDGKYGERAYENFKKDFPTKWIEVPEIPSTVMLDEGLDLEIPDCDLYVSYVRHPDIILELAELHKPLILGITPGIGLLNQAQEINPKVVGPRTMCSLTSDTGIPEVDEFAKYFGKPKFHVKLDNTRTIKTIKVNRVSPCGSSEAGANFIKDKKLSVDNLQELALHVCHECRAPRFGHTCDKEISGILHILSLIENIEEEKIFENGRFASFINDLRKEYESRTKRYKEQELFQ
ncbi:MAG: DUF166 family protein [Promethearchaeia archaeon]